MNDLETLRAQMQSARSAYLGSRSDFEEARMRLELAEENYHTAVEAYQEFLEHIRPAAPQEKPSSGEDLWLDPGPDFRNIVRQTGSLTRGERLEARHAVERMGPKAVQPLLGILSDENARHTVRLKVAAGICLAAIGLSLLQVLGVLPGLSAVTQTMNVTMLATVGAGVWIAKPSRMQRRAGIVLASLQTPKVAGAMVDAYEVADEAGRATIGKAIQRIFPRLLASDAQHFTKAQMAAVIRLLDASDSELVIAVLRGLEQIGDRQAVEKVEAIGRGRGSGAHNRRVREAARACLPALLERRAVNRGADILLRPAEAAELPEQLLRAASPAAPVPSETLLRVVPDAAADA